MAVGATGDPLGVSQPHVFAVITLEERLRGNSRDLVARHFFYVGMAFQAGLRVEQPATGHIINFVDGMETVTVRACRGVVVAFEKCLKMCGLEVFRFPFMTLAAKPGGSHLVMFLGCNRVDVRMAFCTSDRKALGIMDARRMFPNDVGMAVAAIYRLKWHDTCRFPGGLLWACFGFLLDVTGGARQ